MNKLYSIAYKAMTAKANVLITVGFVVVVMSGLVAARYVPSLQSSASTEILVDNQSPLGERIELIAPQGGEQIRNGEVYSIAWSTQSTGTVSIALINNGCVDRSCLQRNTVQYMLADQVPAQSSRFEWTVGGIPADTNYRLVIVGDESGAYAMTKNPITISE